VGVGRYLNLDRLAARLNRWIGATAIADKAAPRDASTEEHAPLTIGVARRSRCA
jgi:hypothetical protein